MQDHRDDVRAAARGAATEDHADGHAVDQACHHGVEEVVGHEPHAVVRLHHRKALDGCGHYRTVVDHRVVAPQPAFDGEGEAEDEEGGDDGLHAELGPENPCADDQQRHIHADGPYRYLAAPEGAEYVGEAVGAAGGHHVGVDEHHVASCEQCAAHNQQNVGVDFFFTVCFRFYLCHNSLCINL